MRRAGVATWEDEVKCQKAMRELAEREFEREEDDAAKRFERLNQFISTECK